MNELKDGINGMINEGKYGYPILKSGTKQFNQLWDSVMDDYEKKHPYVRGFGYGKEQWINGENGVSYKIPSYIRDSNSVTKRKDHDEITKENPLDYVYRAVSPEEFDFIMKNGYIKSNQSKNIGYEVDNGLTCYNKGFSGFYLPENGGYHLKVKATPDMKYDEHDGYIKTPEKVSIDNIVDVNGIPFKKQTSY